MRTRNRSLLALACAVALSACEGRRLETGLETKSEDPALLRFVYPESGGQLEAITGGGCSYNNGIFGDASAFYLARPKILYKGKKEISEASVTVIPFDFTDLIGNDLQGYLFGNERKVYSKYELSPHNGDKELEFEVSVPVDYPFSLTARVVEPSGAIHTTKVNNVLTIIKN